MAIIRSIKSLSLFVLVLSAVFGLQQENPSKQKTVAHNWCEVKNAFEHFVLQPTQKNAKLFLDAIPDMRKGDLGGDKAGVLRYLLEARAGEDYIIFENEILAGNEYALQAALRLYEYADNPFSSEICKSLSTFVRINPSLFLDILFSNLERAPYKKGTYPINCFRTSYAFRSEAQLYELEMRIEALESVKDERLAMLKNECISQLRSQIERMASDPRFPSPAEDYEAKPPESVKKAFETFAEWPSLENAKALSDAIPLEETKGVTDGIYHLIFIKKFSLSLSEGYRILENEALAGNRYSVEALFRMYHLTYGGIETEELLFSLGKLIRINPALFLSVLNKFQNVLEPDWKDNILIFGAFPYFGQEQEKFILKMRIKALENVVDPQLKKLKDTCIDKLNKAMEDFSKGHVN